MNKLVGFLLLGLSSLTVAIVYSLHEIANSIKEAASGNYSRGGLPDFIFILIGLSVFISILCFVSKDKE
ncbi:hypothetical protein ACEU2D_06205 [Brevibacillus laterosporus]|uniref:hypothetical protein n=1 Tax=Brevibacillus laterosporus TaxID=1465 RepID=UPI000839B657